jgi:hypothetical protein
MQLNYYFAIEVRHYQTYSLYNLKYLMGKMWIIRANKRIKK